jgi:hypothetical protein
MRPFCQSAFFAAVVLLAALPHLLADDAKPPVQVQIDVVVLACPLDALAGTKLKCDAQKPCVTECLSATERSALYETVRAHRQTRLLAEPKMVAVSGRPCTFLSGGQIPVPGQRDGHAAVEFRRVGLEVTVTPTVQAGGRLMLDCQFRHSDQTSEWSAATAVELTAGQTVAVVQTPPSPGKEGERKSHLLLITPAVLSTPAPAPAESQPERLKKIAAMLADEYRAACDAHDTDLAAKLARHALDLDPTCFHKLNAPLAPAGLPTLTVPPIPAESKPTGTKVGWFRGQTSWMSDQPSHMTPDRVHGGIP